MKRLSHVAFAHPIPIPGTHLRQQDFGSHDGWTITDEDGCITLQRGDVRFYTYVSASCVEAAEPEPYPKAHDRHPIFDMLKSDLSASSSVGQSSEQAPAASGPQPSYVAGSTPASPSKRKR